MKYTHPEALKAI